MVCEVHPTSAAAEDAHAELLANVRVREKLPTRCLQSVPIGSQTGRHKHWVVAPVELVAWDDLVQGFRPCTTRVSGRRRHARRHKWSALFASDGKPTVGRILDNSVNI